MAPSTSRLKSLALPGFFGDPELKPIFSSVRQILLRGNADTALTHFHASRSRIRIEVAQPRSAGIWLSCCVSTASVATPGSEKLLKSAALLERITARKALSRFDFATPPDTPVPRIRLRNKIVSYARTQGVAPKVLPPSLRNAELLRINQRNRSQLRRTRADVILLDEIKKIAAENAKRRKAAKNQRNAHDTKKIAQTTTRKTP